MATHEIEPTILASDIEEFMQEWLAYIQENPKNIASLEFTDAQRKSKPFLLAPCLVRLAGKCPYKKDLPPCCQLCAHPKATIQLIKKAAEKNGFSTEMPHRSDDTGSISQIINLTANPYYAVYKQDGDNNGVGTITVVQTHRLVPPKS